MILLHSCDFSKLFSKFNVFAILSFCCHMFSISNSNRTAAQFREELVLTAKKFALRRYRARKHIEECTVNMTPMERLQNHINRIQRKRDNFLYKNRNPKDELSERIANFRAYKQYKNALTAFSRRRKILVLLSSLYQFKFFQFRFHLFSRSYCSIQLFSKFIV